MQETVDLAQKLNENIRLRDGEELDEDALRKVVFPTLRDNVPQGTVNEPLLDSIYQMVKEHGMWVAASNNVIDPDEVRHHQDIATEELASTVLRQDFQTWVHEDPQSFLRQVFAWAHHESDDRQERLAWWFRLQKAVRNGGTLKRIARAHA